MSMSLFVVLALEMEPKVHELNEAASTSGYELSLSETIELSSHSGFFPVKFEGQDTGFELYFFPVSEVPEQLKSVIPVSLHDGNIYQLSFGYKAHEAQAAFATAMNMNIKYNGVTIEDQAGTLLSVEQLKAAMASFDEM
ncbi:hypothetical protein ACMXYV_06765 [Neptuniibacter sp. SY11_33]|uniref:hypothetical protein n=1 Tax=Neptuniibacter sp. SY11_33 TaxID=3398215 RepID=UPI0039F539FE